MMPPLGWPEMRARALIPTRSQTPMREVVIAAAARTPIGRFGGALSGLTAAELGAAAAREALARARVRPDQVQEAVFGCARQAGAGPNVARQIAWRAKLPQEVPA